VCVSDLAYHRCAIIQDGSIIAQMDSTADNAMEYDLMKICSQSLIERD
jgi:hypothetical protein